MTTLIQKAVATTQEAVKTAQDLDFPVATPRPGKLFAKWVSEGGKLVCKWVSAEN